MIVTYRTTSIIVFMFSLTYDLSLVVQGLHPEVLLNFEQRVKLHGYPVEIHKLTTKDDYIITLYRIPHGLENKGEQNNKSAILMVSGMGGAAVNLIVLGRKVSPAYYFADQDFDVWVMCARGVECQNPKKHKRYDWSKNSQYWKYSFHEIGLYDVSASIDHILNVTRQKKIFFIGHSGGGPELFALLSERPEYNEKIKISTIYGAIATFKSMDNPNLAVFAHVMVPLKNFLEKTLGMAEIFPGYLHTVIVDFGREFCAHPLYRKACYYSITGTFIANKKSYLDSADIAEVLWSNFPRISTQEFYHYMDNIKRGDFRKYDWGPKKNLKVYGEKIPPLYNLSSSTCFQAFFYGATDIISGKEDNKALIKLLPSTILEYDVGPTFNHMDFVYAKNATHMVYEPTVKLFRDFDEGKIVPNQLIRKSWRDKN